MGPGPPYLNWEDGTMLRKLARWYLFRWSSPRARAERHGTKIKDIGVLIVRYRTGLCI